MPWFFLGLPKKNQTARPVRVVGYKISGVKYYVATDSHDLTAEQIATVNKLRWPLLHEMIPNSLFHVIPATGHLVIEEQPEQLIGKIRPFFQREQITW